MILKDYNSVKHLLWRVMQNVNELLKGLNILYAEDDDTIRVNTAKTLELFCNKVFAVDNGASALELFKKEPVNIIILDYVMPLVDGYNVAKEIRKIDKNIPIFITSSYTEKDKLLSMIGLNIIGYLEKPIEFNALIQTLRMCVDILVENGKIKSSLGEDIEYDYINKSLIIADIILKLTKHEYQLIEILLKHKPSVVLKENIEDEIFDGSVDQNTLRNLVYRLRKKIGKDIILTVKDIGYMLK